MIDQNMVPDNMSDFATKAEQFVRKAKEGGASNIAIKNTLDMMSDLTKGKIEQRNREQQQRLQREQFEYGKTQDALSNELEREKFNWEKQSSLGQFGLQSGAGVSSTEDLGLQEMGVDAQFSDMVEAYADQIKNGNMNISSVPQEMRGAVVSYMSKNPSVTKEDLSFAERAYDVAEKLSKSGTKAATGRYDLFRPFSQKAADVGSELNNLVNILSFENIDKLKGQGQITENEREMLKSAVSGLQLNEKGFSLQSEDLVQEKIDIIKNILGEKIGVDQGENEEQGFDYKSQLQELKQKYFDR